MWGLPTWFMKKINMRISFVYDHSIQGNYEDTVLILSF